MRYIVRTLSRAERDAQQIYDWIKERSPDGALRWWDAYLDACQSLAYNPERNALAPEAQWGDDDVRQALFKTRRGVYYRALYIVSGKEVHVLRVRGPGQPDLLSDELL
jgi:plasmid stabilization system protein ParE